eukprot:420483-Rhodomonas_salina.1
MRQNDVLSSARAVQFVREIALIKEKTLRRNQLRFSVWAVQFVREKALIGRRGHTGVHQRAAEHRALYQRTPQLRGLTLDPRP